MTPLRLLLMGYLLVAATPLLRPDGATAGSSSRSDFPGWPGHFQHYRLSPLEMDPSVLEAFSSFPGKVQAFDSDGGRWILRWIYRPSRQVHPAAHCLRSAGYQIDHQGLERDPYEVSWAHFEAGRDGSRLNVHEQIFDDRGKVWTDVSAWYWNAVRGTTLGPWWAVTRIQETSPNER